MHHVRFTDRLQELCLLLGLPTTRNLIALFAITTSIILVFVLTAIPVTPARAQAPPPLSKDKTTQAMWETVIEANMRQDPAKWITVQALNEVYNDHTPPVSREKTLKAIVEWQGKYQQWNEINKRSGLVDKLDAGISLLAASFGGDPDLKLTMEGVSKLYDKLFSPYLHDKAKIADAVAESQLRYQLWDTVYNNSTLVKGALDNLYHRGFTDDEAKDVVNLILAPLTNVQIGDDVPTMLQHVGATNPELAAALHDLFLSDGSPAGSETEWRARVENLLSIVMDQMTDDRGYLKTLSSQQKSLLEWFKDEDKRRQEEQTAAERARLTQLKLDAAQSSIYLLSTFIGFGNPKLGHEIAVAGNAAIQIADGISKLGKSLAALDTATKLEASLTSVVLTGNIIGAAMQIFSLFGDSGPSPEQMILEQLQALRQQIAELRQEMHARFDQIDAELNQIYTTLNERFDLVDWQLGRLNGKVDEIQAALFGLQEDLSRIEKNIYHFLDAHDRVDLLEFINGKLRYAETYGHPMSEDLFNEAEAKFYTWVIDRASDELHAGFHDGDFSDQAIYDALKNFSLAFNINYLSQYTQKVLGLPVLSLDLLANPWDLAMGTEAYLELLKENPQYARNLSPEHLQNIRAKAKKVQTAIERISNASVFDGLLGKYDTTTTDVQQQIQVLENKYKEEKDVTPQLPLR